MSRFVLLNNVDHHDLKVAVRHGPAFGDAVNQLLLFPTEFEAAQREFPIAFRRDDAGEFLAVALLGLDRDENLFFADNQWQSRYIPAIQRRGPFRSQARDADGEVAIHVDLDDPRVGTAEGEPLYLRHGGSAPHLQKTSAVLETIRWGHAAAAPMYAAWLEFGLIQPIELDISLGDGTRYIVPDLFTIARDALDGLDGAALEKLHRAGHLRAAILASASLGNVERLIELKLRRT